MLVRYHDEPLNVGELFDVDLEFEPHGCTWFRRAELEAADRARSLMQLVSQNNGGVRRD